MITRTLPAESDEVVFGRWWPDHRTSYDSDQHEREHKDTDWVSARELLAVACPTLRLNAGGDFS